MRKFNFQANRKVLVMKILVTGGAGFIGSALVRLAIARGHSVINVDALTYAGCLDNLASVVNSSSYTFQHVDIRNRNRLKSVFEEHTPDAVVHLAAESHVDRSIDEPTNFIETNLNGTFNMLEAARNYWNGQGNPKRFRFLHVSTDEVYGSLPSDPSIKFTEHTPYDPRSPYAASKAGSDHLVRAWYQTYGLPILLTNCSNNYGPYQFPEKLIPVAIINSLLGNSIPIYGEGGNTRDWLHVEDHADALLLVLQQGRLGQNYNIGGENESTNLELVRALCSILDRLRQLKAGSYSDLITFVVDRPGHDERYAINADLIRNELGWKPAMNLEAGLEQTVQWYLDNERWWQPLLKRTRVGKRLGSL